MLRFYQRWALLPGLVLLVLFLYMTGTGLGGTSDSVNYLWAAHTLRAVGRLLAPNGTPYRFWGPLYPMLLAACYSPTGVRVLHGAALLVQLVLWHRVGRWLLPTGRAWALPWLVALSAALLVPAAFIWSETVFGALAAAYFYALFTWFRRGGGGWLGLATAAGFLLPLQRTSGFFWLAGVGAGLLLTGPVRGRWRPLLLHWSVCATGGLAWSYYAEVLAGPPTYQTHYPWNALGSLADYGFVLARWFIPLAASWRDAVPALWALVLLGILVCLYPKKAAGVEAATALAVPQQLFPPLRGLRLLWWTVVLTVLLLLLATSARRAAVGSHNAERYCALLVGPVALLALARWPGQGGREKQWLGPVLLGGWLAYSAIRAGHNAQQQRQRPPLAWPDSELQGPSAPVTSSQ